MIKDKSNAFDTYNKNKYDSYLKIVNNLLFNINVIILQNHKKNFQFL
jgi:hypothetical protein